MADLPPRSPPPCGLDEDPSRCVRGIVHELRTPLGSILMLAEMLVAELEDDTAAERARRIQQAAQEIRALLGALGELAKLDGGGAEVAASEVPVGELLRELESRRGAADRLERRVRCELDSAVPRSIRTDRARLGEALDQLLVWALEVTAPEETVVVKALAEPAGVAFTVRCGAPLADSDREALWVAFRGPRRRRRGSQLGLPLAAATARLLGGRLEAEADEDGGHLLTLRLPASWGPGQAPGGPAGGAPGC